MAKSKKSQNAWQSLLPVIACGLGVIALIMLFLPAIAVKDGNTTYSGWQVIFGLVEKTPLTSTNVTILGFSVPLFIGFLLTAVGATLALLQFLKKNRLFAMISASCFVIAAVIWFLQVPLFVVGDGLTLGGWLNVKESFVLGAGAIVGGIMSILACAAQVVNILLDK